MFFKREVRENNRAFRRARSFCIIKYCLAGDQVKQKTLANPRNLSAGGLLFAAQKHFPKDTMLDIDMYIPPLKGFFTVVATVVNSAREGAAGEYAIRVKFTAIDPEARKHINNLIEEMANNPSLSQYLDKGGSKPKRPT